MSLFIISSPVGGGKTIILVKKIIDAFEQKKNALIFSRSPDEIRFKFRHIFGDSKIAPFVFFAEGISEAVEISENHADSLEEVFIDDIEVTEYELKDLYAFQKRFSADFYLTMQTRLDAKNSAPAVSVGKFELSPKGKSLISEIESCRSRDAARI